MKPLARFVIRKDGGLLLGKAFSDSAADLKPDTIYQIEEILGELIIREIGPSVIRQEGMRPNWNNTANEIVQDGSHLYTGPEYKAICERDNKK